MGNAMGLVQHGAQKPRVIQHLFNANDWSMIELLKIFIPRATHNGHLVYIWYTYEEIAELGFDKDEADSLILTFMMRMKNTAVFAIIRLGSTEMVG